jgi:hypothetical protein
MRVRDHVAVSTVPAALVLPWSGRTALNLWAGSVLVDIDHYLWFGVQRRDWNPAAAVRFFNGALPPQHSTTRFLHSPAAAVVLLLLGLHRRWLLSVALGVSLHIALDAQHDTRMAEARLAALARDDYTCQACGTRARVGTHLRRQPWLLPSYGPRHLISLCASCHENAHARGAR